GAQPGGSITTNRVTKAERNSSIIGPQADTSDRMTSRIAPSSRRRTITWRAPAGSTEYSYSSVPSAETAPPPHVRSAHASARTVGRSRSRHLAAGPGAHCATLASIISGSASGCASVSPWSITHLYSSLRCRAQTVVKYPAEPSGRCHAPRVTASDPSQLDQTWCGCHRTACGGSLWRLSQSLALTGSGTNITASPVAYSANAV